MDRLVEETDANRSTLCDFIKASFRNVQRTRTSKQRVAAIARMNEVNKIANTSRNRLIGKG